MAFDPTKPVENSPLDAAQMRDQLNALKDLIDTRAPHPTHLEPLNLVAGATYDYQQMQQIAMKLDELIAALLKP
jgi:hypothetical protein